MKITPSLSPFQTRPRPSLVGDGVSIHKEKTEGCDRRELLLDQLERQARLNMLYVQGLKSACHQNF
jgi:hypothetical protein